MSDEKKGEIKKQTVNSILDNFRNNLFGIEYYFDKFGSLAQGEDVDEIKRNSEFIQECFKEIGINLKASKKEREENKISEDKLLTFVRKLKKQPKISAKNYDILSKSSFLMLNNYFEYLLSDLLSYHYNKFQKSLNEKKFNLALKEINEFESIEEFTKALITKEVESMMVELTFDELLEHFHNVLGIDNEKEIINWDKIRECRERRHLIVHNSSIVNHKYLSRTNNPNNFKAGELIHIDKEYFLSSCKEFFLAGLLLSYNAWGKWDKEFATEAIKEMMVDSFELLKQNEFQLVLRLTEYTQKIEGRNEEQEDFLLRTLFNRLISLKKLGNESALSKELKKMKMGTASPIFKLAHSILSENHKNIIELVKQSKAMDEIDIVRYNEWPIYEFVRNNETIHKKIEEELSLTGAKIVLPKAGLDKQKPNSTAKSSPVPAGRTKPSKRKLTSTKK